MLNIVSTFRSLPRTFGDRQTFHRNGTTHGEGTTIYNAKPWLASYPEGQPATIETPHPHMLAVLEANVARSSHLPAIHYFDSTLSWGYVDRAAESLAAVLVARGFRRGDRLALCLQNDPAFVVGLLAAWKAGGIAALLSPMSRQRELTDALRDCEPAALLILDDVYEDVARDVLADGDLRIHTVVTVSPRHGQLSDDDRIFAGDRREVGDTLDFGALVELGLPLRGSPRTLADDVAVLAYTSGTTGQPRAAMLTHRNLAYNTQTYCSWTGLVPGEVILGLSPVFHVSGLVGGVLLSLALGSPIVLTHRFHPEVVKDAIRARRPAFAVAAVTAYVALAENGADADLFSSFRVLYSGGAPIEPAVADRLEAVFGHYIHNMYGQTETTSPSHAVPAGTRAPVDPETGALSVGLPVYGTVTRVVDSDGVDLPVGAIGELVTTGPQVARGYWRPAPASAQSLRRDELWTGDVGFMDAHGWFYVVDRLKDLINASGYKVWPREVERVLATHPEVREAAVVGIPDDYRGESVKAYVALTAGAFSTESDLIDFCRGRMAAFKYPREVEIVAELPRTATGKVLRRALRPSS